MRRVTYVLPWPPSANGAKACVGKRMIKTKKAREYHEAALIEIRHQRTSSNCIHPGRISGPVDVYLDFYPPTLGARDIFNFEKLPIDAIVEAGVIDDDSMIDGGVPARREKVQGGKVVVTIVARVARDEAGKLL